MFEGVPTYPDASRFWQVCEKHKVNQFYTAPTAIRALMGKGTSALRKPTCQSQTARHRGRADQPGSLELVS